MDAGCRYPEQVQAYCDQLKRLLADVESADQKRQLEPFGELRGLIQGYGAYTLSDAEVEQLRLGFLTVMDRVRSERAALVACIDEWLGVLQSFDPPLVGIESIDRTFLTRVIDAVCGGASGDSAN